MNFKHYCVMVIAFLVFSLPCFAQDDYIVKLFYFLPNDREAQPDIDAKIDNIIKKTQLYYADMMETQGFGRKTFQFETDGNGNAVVHHVIGKEGSASYVAKQAKSFNEIDKSLYTYNKTIIVVYLDHGKNSLTYSDETDACGLAYPGKRVLIPASGGCFGVGVTAHELGHTFGLPHGVGGLQGMSKCATVALDVNRYFNPNQIATKDNEAQVKMLSSSIAYPPNNRHIFFEVADPEGPILARFIEGGNLHSCDLVSSEKGIVKFITFGQPIENKKITVVTFDKNGGVTSGKKFSLDDTELSMVLDISIASIGAQNGLIGYWTLDEAKGPYAFNTIGNDHHAVMQEGVILQPNIGKIGGALRTTWQLGANVKNGKYLINELEAFTIALWVKSDGVNTNRGFISSKKPNAKDDTFSLRYDAVGSKGGANIITAAIQTTSGIQTYESAGNVQNTEWQHIALTWQSGQKLKLYINGILDQPTSNSRATQGKLTGANRLVIGKGSNDNHNAWRGLLDDVRLYNKVLSAKEIADLPHVTQIGDLVHGVSIAGAANITDETIQPNADVEHILTVTNVGNTNDTIKLATSGNTDSTLSQTSVSLAPGASSEVTLIIPQGIVGENMVKVTATSEGDSTKTAQITATTSINSISGVSLEGVESLSTEKQNTSAEIKYTLTVTNIGNTNDTIQLTTSGDVTATLDKTSVFLTPSASSEVTLTVPRTMLADVHDYAVNVTATSGIDGTKTDQVTTIIYVFSAEDIGHKDGLISHWSFDEPSGNIAADANSNHNAILQDGGVTFAPNEGRIGGAIRFNGSGEGVSVVNGRNLINGLKAFTIALWVKSDKVTHRQRLYFPQNT